MLTRSPSVFTVLSLLSAVVYGQDFTFQDCSNYTNYPLDTGCTSYGIDFSDSGSYFINSLSNDSFTFVSQFENCFGNATVFAVDPAGNQYQCSSVNASLFDVNEVSTCPFTKAQMATLGGGSGEWILELLGNNGPCPNAPFAYMRAIDLTIAPQITTTVTPTATSTDIIFPTITTNSTTTTTETSVLQPVTVTSPAATTMVSFTQTPSTVTTYSTRTITWSRTGRTWSTTTITSTMSASCSIPPRKIDRFATVKPTLQKVVAALTTPASGTSTAAPGRSKHANRNDNGLGNDEGNVKERLARMAKARHAERGVLERRAPDPPTITIMASAFVVTSTITTTTSTATDVSVVTVIITSTPPPKTVVYGTLTSIETVTAPTPTRTRTARVWVTSTVMTSTIWRTATSTTTWMPDVTSCTKNGGHIVHPTQGYGPNYGHGWQHENNGNRW